MRKLIYALIFFSFVAQAAVPDPEYVQITREEVAIRVDRGEITQAEGEEITRVVLQAKWNPPVGEVNRMVNHPAYLVMGFLLTYTADKALDSVWVRAEQRYMEFVNRRERERQERERRERRSIQPGNGPSCRMPGRNPRGRPGQGAP